MLVPIGSIGGYSFQPGHNLKVFLRYLASGCYDENKPNLQGLHDMRYSLGVRNEVMEYGDSSWEQPTD